LLELIEGETGLWERFQQEPEAFGPAADGGILQRWARARELGVLPDGDAHPLGVASHELEVRRETALGTMREGTSILEALEADVGARGLFALVAAPRSPKKFDGPGSSPAPAGTRALEARTPSVPRSSRLARSRWSVEPTSRP
jgi:hypothetical protein